MKCQEQARPFSCVGATGPGLLVLQLSPSSGCLCRHRSRGPLAAGSCSVEHSPSAATRLTPVSFPMSSPVKRSPGSGHRLSSSASRACTGEPWPCPWALEAHLPCGLCTRELGEPARPHGRGAGAGRRSQDTTGLLPDPYAVLEHVGPPG